MQIQINAPRIASDDFAEIAEERVRGALSPYAERLTRIEVHLRDLNADKGGIDKHCLIEARPRGLDPVTAEHDGERIQDALRGALDKLGRVLEKRFGRLDTR